MQSEKRVTDRHYSPRGYWRVVGVLVAAKEQNGMLVVLTGNAVVEGLKRRIVAGTFNCAFGGLAFKCIRYASGALANAFKSDERGELTNFDCPGMLDLRGNP